MQDMKTIKVQLHLVATEEKSHIHKLAHGYITFEKKLSLKPSSCIPSVIGKPQHLYFTSDEEIKDGDHFLYKGIRVCTCTEVSVFKNSEGIEYVVLTDDDKSAGFKLENCRKIVASTDPKLNESDLYKHTSGRQGTKPLPQPTKQLVEAYCKKPFDECLIEVEQYDIEYSKMSHIKDKSTRQAMMTTAIPINMKIRVKVNSYNEITCYSVVEKMYSSTDLLGNQDGSLDHFLLHSTKFRQEDREIIMDAIYEWVKDDII
jgi:hypothetical protein